MLRIASCRPIRHLRVPNPHRQFLGTSLRALGSKTDVPDPFDSHFVNTITVENIKSSLKPWIIKCVDRTLFKELTFEEQATVFNRLLMVHCFEVFLHTKYMSNRKYLFDCEVVLPALCSLIDRSLINGAKSFVIGLSQLSQLTRLSKLTGDSEETILTELLKCRNDFSLDDALEDDTSYLILDEDVVSEFIEPAKTQPYELSLIGPPTPASAAYPLMMGRAKGLQSVDKDDDSDSVWPIFCYPISEICSKDTFNNIVNILKEPDLSPGGTIHIFINCEHGGFEDRASQRSLESSTQLIKLLADMVKTPVVHVKAEEVDSVVYVMNMVSDFRSNHKRDIIVNLMVGHHKPPHKNTASTRTLAGFLIEFLSGGKDPLVALYGRELISNKLMSKIEFDDRKETYLRKLLEQSNPKATPNSPKGSSTLEKRVKEPFTGGNIADLGQMVESLQTYQLLNRQHLDCSNDDFSEPVAIAETLAVRDCSISVDNANITSDLDWHASVSLAYASLLKEGCHVHVSRTARGPASSICDPQVLIPNSDDNGEFKLRESLLSPFATAGFLVGFSSVGSNVLAVWEVPQNIEPTSLHEITSNYFGCNKPNERLLPKAVFLVPSALKVPSSESTSVQVSCQPSQILKICEDSDTLTGFSDQLHNCNVVVANLSSPANLFHLICRHGRSVVPRPLIVFVPNDSTATSNIQEISGETWATPFEVGHRATDIYPQAASTGRTLRILINPFLPYIGDTSVLDPNIKNVILCSGRIYHHLKAERARRKMDRQIAISRVEQLCPFPYSNLIQDIERFPSARIWWAQEEEISDGCWNYVESRLLGLFGEERVVRYTGHYRPNGSSYPPPALENRIAAILDVIVDS